MPNQLWIVEARDESGSLSFIAPQPETFFGLIAITGMTEEHMAKVIFNKVPEAALTGDNIPNWPKLLDARFTARLKTW